jgi:hypothetical protein
MVLAPRKPTVEGESAVILPLRTFIDDSTTFHPERQDFSPEAA